MTPTQREPGEVAGATPEEVGALPLLAEGVSVAFGGLEALRDVDIRIAPGEIVGLIGGNGAGKTTFIDCVSGYVEPSARSRLTSFGHDLGGIAPELRPYFGIVRSFQDARLYPGLSVVEALLVALERRSPSPLLGSLLALPSVRRAEAAKREEAEELIESFGLVPFRDKRISELSTGTRRVADLATVVAQRPRLLLLDEPTSGLAQKESEAFGPILRWLRDKLDCAVLIVEHDMPLIIEVSDRLYALESGRVIAEGRPRHVVEDERVVASYLGLDEVAIQRSGSSKESVPLAALTRAELLRRGRSLGLPVTTRMRKAELVGLIEGHAAVGGASGRSGASTPPATPL